MSLSTHIRFVDVIGLLGHEFINRTKSLLYADIGSCEIALVLLDRYLKVASSLNHLNLSDIQTRREHIVTQLYYLWISCLIISIKMNCDIHYTMGTYANNLRLDMHNLNVAERQVFAYLLHHSTLFVTNEQVSYIRSCGGVPSLIRMLPVMANYEPPERKNSKSKERTTKHCLLGHRLSFNR